MRSQRIFLGIFLIVGSIFLMITRQKVPAQSYLDDSPPLAGAFYTIEDGGRNGWTLRNGQKKILLESASGQPGTATDIFFLEVLPDVEALKSHPRAIFYLPSTKYTRLRVQYLRNPHAVAKNGLFQELEKARGEKRLVLVYGSVDIFPGLKIYMHPKNDRSAYFYGVRTQKGIYALSPVEPGPKFKQRMERVASSPDKIKINKILVNQRLSQRSDLWNMHEHIGSIEAAKRYLDVAKKWGIEKTVLFADYSWIYGNSSDNTAAVMEIHRTFPGRFMPFVLIRLEEPDKLTFLQKMVKDGAVGVNIRGGFKKTDVRIDSRDLWPVYEYCEKNNLPVVIHLEKDRTESIQNILRSFPRLRVSFTHLFYSLDNLDYVRSLFERYPNLYTDITYGYLPWVRTSFPALSKNRDKLRKLVKDYPDRFLWGTDSVVTMKSFQDRSNYLDSIMMLYRSLYETSAFVFPFSKPETTLRGLGLEKVMLDKIYRSNAQHFMNGPSTPAAGGPAQNTDTIVLLTGSSLLGEGMNKEGRARNPLAPDVALAEYLKAADILHLSNETAILDSVPKRQKWKFYSTPQNMLLAKELGVDVIELTGNHLLDYGAEPAKRLLTMLRAWAVPYFGGGATLEDAKRALTLVRGQDRVTFIGYSFVSGIAGKETPGASPYNEEWMLERIRAAKQSGNIVLVHFQWGDEFNPQPYLWQRRLAYKAIDEGADLVVGTHTHAPAGFEFYKGKGIYYGLGNFLFDHPGKDTEVGLMLRLTCRSGSLFSVVPVPVQSKSGKISLMTGVEKDAYIKKWSAYENRFSNDVYAKRSVTVHDMVLQDLDDFSVLRRFFNNSGIRKATLFMEATQLQRFRKESSKNTWLKEIVEPGLQVAANMPYDARLAEGISSFRWELPSTHAVEWMQKLKSRAVRIHFGKDWRVTEIVEFISKNDNASVQWSFDLSHLSGPNAASIAALLSRHKNVWLLYSFDSYEEKKELIEKYADRIRIRYSRSTANVTAASREFIFIRNRLENREAYLPVSDKASLEWGYPYDLETKVPGLALDLATLEKIYD